MNFNSIQHFFLKTLFIIRDSRKNRVFIPKSRRPGAITSRGCPIPSRPPCPATTASPPGEREGARCLFLPYQPCFAEPGAGVRAGTLPLRVRGTPHYQIFSRPLGTGGTSATSGYQRGGARVQSLTVSSVTTGIGPRGGGMEIG